jgi:hypothetical protein
VLIENTVILYEFGYGNSTTGRWEESKWYPAFALPAGYDGVFGFNFSGPVIAVVFENTARFYRYYGIHIYNRDTRRTDAYYDWRESEDMHPLVLPRGYDSAYGFYNDGYGEIIAVNIQNTVKFYEFIKRCARQGWEELSGKVFDAPDGYMVFTRDGDIGTFDGNSIKFFGFNGNEWFERIPSAK